MFNRKRIAALERRMERAEQHAVALSASVGKLSDETRVSAPVVPSLLGNSRAFPPSVPLRDVVFALARHAGVSVDVKEPAGPRVELTPYPTLEGLAKKYAKK